MAKIFRFYDVNNNIDAEYITDGLLEHKTFFLTEVRGKLKFELLNELNLKIKQYSQRELIELSKKINVNLDLYNDNVFIKHLNLKLN